MAALPDTFPAQARYVTFSAVVVLLVLLAWAGKRVTYDQSISSFFADDDPDMQVYQQAAATFGDDNFVFVVYDDPELLTPAGMDRVEELAARRGARARRGRAASRIDRYHAAALGDRRRPARARSSSRDSPAISPRTPPSARVKNIDLKSSSMTVAGAVRAAADARPARGPQGSPDDVIPCSWATLIDAAGTATAVVVRLEEDKSAQRDRDDRRAEADLADEFAARHGLGRPAVVGPPVLLADGFSAIEVDGRRLAVVGMILIGVVTLSAVHSLWWAIVPMLAGWVIWLATEAILATFNIKLSLSGGPLVAQIIVLTMPAASHLAIHFRDDRRREADPRRAARATLASVAAPIVWTALTGAIGYGALVTSDVMPIRQFGAILGNLHLRRGVLVMLISPIAMLPPFRMEIPVRYGSRSRVAGFMNRLVLWVYHRPLAIVATVLAIVLPLACGLVRLSYETNYINLFRPETRVVGDYHKVESRLGGIGVVELVVPVGRSIKARTLARAEGRGGSDPRESASPTRKAVAAGALARDGARPRRHDWRRCPRDRRDQLIADKLDLIAASPQSELLPSFWNAETGESRLLIRLKEQQSAPDKTEDLPPGHRGRRRAFRPNVLFDRSLALDDPNHQAIIATQWGTFLWSAIGILIMLTLAFRSFIAGRAGDPADAAFGRSGSGPDGLAEDQARHGDGPGGERRPGALGGRHVSLPSAVPPRRQDRAVSQAIVR